MATNPQIPVIATVSSASNNHHPLFAAIDMGTNSFKLRIVRADPKTGRFLTLQRLKEPVVLVSSTTAIPYPVQLHAIESLRKFQQILHSLKVPPSHLRLVATSAVRESSNQSQFLQLVHQTLGLEVDVVSGYEEARLTYLGVLQFHPVYNHTVLTIDIGGGSTEFVVGFEGKVLLGISLKLGHLTLTQRFVRNNEIEAMREHIRVVIKESGLIEKILQYKIDFAVGSSGSIRMIEKAVFFGYSNDLVNELGLLEGYRRDWKFTREELSVLVEKLCKEEEREVEGEKAYSRKGFFKKRSEFIVAGVILLEEIFGLLGIEEMKVSGYALGEGVIAEKLDKVFDGFDLNANARWRSVVRLATRFNTKKRMTSAASCTAIAQGIFEGLRKWSENGDKDLLDDKDLEYLEAACLLHNIGMFTSKKEWEPTSWI